MVQGDRPGDAQTEVERAAKSKGEKSFGPLSEPVASRSDTETFRLRSSSRITPIPQVTADLEEHLGEASDELVRARSVVALSGSRRHLETRRLQQFSEALRRFQRFVVSYRFSAERRLAGSQDVSFQVKSASALNAGFYLGSADSVVAMRLTKAIQSVALQMGYIGLQIERVESGSVWVTFSTRWKAFWADPRTTTTAKDLANEVREYAEAMTVEKAVADVSLTSAKAISELMASLKDEEYAAVDLQNVLLLKYIENGKRMVIAHTMTSKERAVLQRNPELRAHPGKMLSRLADLTMDTGSNPDSA